MLGEGYVAAANAYLRYADPQGCVHEVPLPAELQSLSIGRSPSADISLGWDEAVSRVHSTLQRIAGSWTIADDGLSRNGTYINGDRLRGRHRLTDGDRVRVGGTLLNYRDPQAGPGSATKAVGEAPSLSDLSASQRAVLVALCRPYQDAGRFSTPATNADIGRELFLGVDAVKTHLRVLFLKFGVEDLPHNQKRARLVEKAFLAGLIPERKP